MERICYGIFYKELFRLLSNYYRFSKIETLFITRVGTIQMMVRSSRERSTEQTGHEWIDSTSQAQRSLGVEQRRLVNSPINLNNA